MPQTTHDWEWFVRPIRMMIWGMVYYCVTHIIPFIQTVRWNLALFSANNCFLYRCVHIFNRHVPNLCSSPIPLHGLRNPWKHQNATSPPNAENITVEPQTKFPRTPGSPVFFKPPGVIEFHGYPKKDAYPDWVTNTILVLRGPYDHLWPHPLQTWKTWLIVEKHFIGEINGKHWQTTRVAETFGALGCLDAFRASL